MQCVLYMLLVYKLAHSPTRTS